MIIPLFLMASGMARIPVPMFPLSMWIMTSVLEILGLSFSVLLMGVASEDPLE